MNITDIKLVLRGLLKNKIFSIINIIGLSLAMFTSLVLFNFVIHHYSYDKGVENLDRSYRITTGLGTQGSMWACTFAAFDEVLKTHIGVEKSSTIYKNDESFEVKSNDKGIKLSNIVYAEPDFIDFFNIPLIAGDKNDLAEPNTVIITDNYARSLFGNENPIGKTIEIEYAKNESSNNRRATVVGIVDARVIKKSHIDIDIIHSKTGFYEATLQRIKNLKVYSAYSYLTLVPNQKATDFESQIIPLLEPILGNSAGPQVGEFSYKLQPIKDIHFTNNLSRDSSIGIEKSIINILIIIAFLLFMTALFNSLMMTIARTESKVVQVKILKYLGGNNLTIGKLALLESSVLVLVSIIVALLLFVLFTPLLSTSFLNGWSADLNSGLFWGLLLALGCIVVLITTFSTSVHLSRNKPTAVGYHKQKAIILIIVQFAVIIGLLSYGGIVQKQLSYIQNKELGFSVDNVMVYRVHGRRSNKINTFKERAKKIPGVVGVANANHYPGFRLMDVSLSTPMVTFPFKFAMVDEDFMELMGIPLIQEFSETSKKPIYINQTMYESLNKYYTHEQIVQGDFNSKQQKGSEKIDLYVNGVFPDFHYQSLYNNIGNFSFFIRHTSSFNHRFIMVKFRQHTVESVRQEMAQIAQDLYGVTEFEPVFLDNELNAKYQSVSVLMSITYVFQILTIFIACMGLVGFTLYTTQHRTKEIGIRKVNGATISEILLLLNKGFIKWVAIAFVIAVPVAYYAMHKWLENFAYKTELSWWIFALAGVLALGIALLTVSIQSWRAATRNPVEALRYE